MFTYFFVRVEIILVVTGTLLGILVNSLLVFGAQKYKRWKTHVVSCWPLDLYRWFLIHWLLFYGLLITTLHVISILVFIFAFQLNKLYGLIIVCLDIVAMIFWKKVSVKFSNPFKSYTYKARFTIYSPILANARTLQSVAVVSTLMKLTRTRCLLANFTRLIRSAEVLWRRFKGIIITSCINCQHPRRISSAIMLPTAL